MFAPLRTSVPGPAFVRPATETTGTATFAVAFVPSVFTVIVGLPEATDSASPLDGSPLPSSVQLAAEVVLVSPKTRLPTVRGESSRTVLFAVRLSVLKSAVEHATLTTTPPSQFAPLLQSPPPARLIHAPLAVLLIW